MLSIFLETFVRIRTGLSVGLADFWRMTQSKQDRRKEKKRRGRGRGGNAYTRGVNDTPQRSFRKIESRGWKMIAAANAQERFPAGAFSAGLARFP